jgi:RecJ-like exonuclease
MITCSKCQGSKKISNPDYEKELDRQLDLAPSNDIAESRAKRKYDEFIVCSTCEGKGEIECKHPRSEKEYYLGAQTGDRICLDCGEVFYRG